jgi:hypothetical protein
MTNSTTKKIANAKSNPATLNTGDVVAAGVAVATAAGGVDLTKKTSLQDLESALNGESTMTAEELKTLLLGEPTPEMSDEDFAALITSELSKPTSVDRAAAVEGVISKEDVDRALNGELSKEECIAQLDAIDDALESDTVTEEDLNEIASITAEPIATQAEEDEAEEEPASVEAEEEPETVEAEASSDLNTIIKGVSVRRAKGMSDKLVNQFAIRAEFEKQTSPANTSIQKKLIAYQGKLVLPAVTALMVAIDLDPTFVNRSLSGSGKRFNIYAIDKVADLVMALNTGAFRNAINRCVISSMFRFEKANEPFSQNSAQAAASHHIKVGSTHSGLLVRHTVSESTAPTQASSTMNALLALKVVKNTGSVKHPVWAMIESPTRSRLLEIVS